MIVKTDISPTVVWKLEAIAEKQGKTLAGYLAEIAALEVEKPLVRIDWFEGAANRIHRLMDYGRTDAEITDLLGVHPRTVSRRRNVWLVGNPRTEIPA